MPYALEPGEVALQVARADGGTTVILVAADGDHYMVRDRCVEGLTPDGTGVNDRGLSLREALASARSASSASSAASAPSTGERIRILLKDAAQSNVPTQKLRQK